MGFTKGNISILAAAALMAAAGGAARAGVTNITVPNFSFEQPTLTSGGALGLGPTDGYTDWGTEGSAAIPDFTATIIGGGAGIQNAAASTQMNLTGGGDLPAPGDGVNDLYMNTNSGNSATVTTANSLTTIADGTTYTGTVAIGARKDINGGVYSISLLANGTVVATNSFTNTPTSSIPAGTFQDLSASFTTLAADPLAGESLTIQLGGAFSPLDTGNPNGGITGLQQENFDNIRLTAATPEPATIGLLGLGALGLLRRKRRA